MDKVTINTVLMPTLMLTIPVHTANVIANANAVAKCHGHMRWFVCKNVKKVRIALR